MKLLLYNFHLLRKRCVARGALGCLLAIGGAGCGEGSSPSSTVGIQSKHGHVHVPPHRGTPVVLGDEDFHIEFVHIPQSSTLRCYVLDGHMNEFIRLEQPSIQLVVRRQNRKAPETLELRAVATTATGETKGNTSQFEAQADWLKEYPAAFQATVVQVSIRGVTYTNETFTFPLTEY